jgi:hypothetical protein
MQKLSPRGTILISLRIPVEYLEAFQSIADKKNPYRAIMRDALKQYLRRLGKI